MTISHKEALEKAQDAHIRAKYRERDGHPLEAAIRAYLDALGWVMVPRKLTAEMLQARDGRKGAQENWKAMLTAAPDPFQEASE